MTQRRKKQPRAAETYRSARRELVKTHARQDGTPLHIAWRDSPLNGANAKAKRKPGGNRQQLRAAGLP